MAKRKIGQKQKQKQSTNIVIKIDNAGKKPRRSRPRKSKIVQDGPTRQLPPVVYQTLPQLTYYSTPDATGRISGTPPSSIVAAPKPATNILEDIGSIGTEGLVKILELPTKRETLSELISPVTQKTPPSKAEYPSIISEPPKKPMFPSLESRSPLVVQTAKQPERQPEIQRNSYGITTMVEQPSQITEMHQLEPNNVLQLKSSIGKKAFIIPKQPSETQSFPFASDIVQQKPKKNGETQRVKKPQEMQQNIFSQVPIQEPALFKMPASQLSYPFASKEAINAPLPNAPLPPEKFVDLFSHRKTVNQVAAKNFDVKLEDVTPEMIDIIMQERLRIRASNTAKSRSGKKERIAKLPLELQAEIQMQNAEIEKTSKRAYRSSLKQQSKSMPSTPAGFL